MRLFKLFRVLTLLKHWLLAEMIIVGFCILICVLLNYNLRTAGDDPQVEISRNIAAELAASPDTLGPTDLSGTTSITDPSKSLSTFYMVFASDRALLVSTVNFGAEQYVPADNVFEKARNNGEYRFTWQPSPDLRLAAVINYYKGDKNEGFAMAARSLSEIEARINGVRFYTVIGGLALTLGNTIVFAAAIWIEKKIATAAILAPKSELPKRKPAGKRRVKK
jgi:hypothetical protein